MIPSGSLLVLLPSCFTLVVMVACKGRAGKQVDIEVLCVLVEFLGYVQSLELPAAALHGKMKQAPHVR